MTRREMVEERVARLGVDVDEAVEITQIVLTALEEYMTEHEPYATESIRVLSEAYGYVCDAEE